MKTNGREDSGGFGIILGSDVILAVDAKKVGELEVSDVAARPPEGRTNPDQSVVQSTARSSQRALVALIDGKRTVEELVRLAGMSDLVVRRHLRALCERGIVIPKTSKTDVATTPGTGAASRVGTAGSSAEPEGEGWSKALAAYLDSAKSAVVQAPVPEPVTAQVADALGPTSGSGRVTAANPSAPTVVVGGAVADPQKGNEGREGQAGEDDKAGKAGKPDKPGSNKPGKEANADRDALGARPAQSTAAAPAADPHPDAGASTTAPSSPTGAAPAEGARRSLTPSSFKPNVTAFWIPLPKESAASGTSGAAAAGKAATTDAAAPATRPGAGRSTPAGAAPAVSSSSSQSSHSAAGATTMMWPGPNETRTKGSASPPQETVIVAGSAVPSEAEPATFEPAPPPAVGAAAGAPARNAAIPFRLGEYEVATRIAQGGMGSIYVCRRAGATGAQRLFTLKVVRQHVSQVSQVVQTFRREARVGALLSHPNLQTVVHVGTYHEQPFLILDYVEGIGLAELMASPKRLPPAIVVSILVDVLRGLKSAHDLVDEQGTRLGLVHGDVSPQNILVGVDGNARLTDFGSARFNSDARAPEAAHVLMGKPAFMAPEQLSADPVDARTDLFALGVVMWTALTGQPLFVADSYDQIVMNIFRKKIPPPSEFGAPACFDEISSTALSRAVDGRYPSAEEMANALSRAARAEGIVGSPYDVGQWVRREFAETLAERRRRIQAVFGGGAAGAVAAAGTRDSASSSVAGADAPAGAPGAEKVGSTSVDGFARLPAQTIQLSAMPPRRRSTPRVTPLDEEEPVSRWARWRVVIVSAAIAFPFALTLAYLATNPLVRRLRAPRATSAAGSVGGTLPKGDEPGGASQTPPPPSAAAPAAPPAEPGPARGAPKADL